MVKRKQLKKQLTKQHGDFNTKHATNASQGKRLMTMWLRRNPTGAIAYSSTAGVYVTRVRRRDTVHRAQYTVQQLRDVVLGNHRNNEHVAPAAPRQKHKRNAPRYPAQYKQSTVPKRVK